MFDRPILADVKAAFHDRLKHSHVLESIQPEMSIAVGVGSRGVYNQPLIVRALIDRLKIRGAKPFIFSAMGSHGGATAEGQQTLLARMGVTEQAMGAPVRATMDVVAMGTAENGLTEWFDAYAAAADGIVLVSRIKPHVSFRGKYESGLMKMIAIGLGKQKGAEVCHQQGMERMLGNIETIGRTALSTGKILFGVALLENAYRETCRIEAVPAHRIEEEVALQAEAKGLEPRILFNQLDALTSAVPTSVKIPMVLKTDRLAIQAAIKTCNIADFRNARLGRIKNTLEAHRMEISENLLAEARANPKIKIRSDAYGLKISSEGNLW